MSSSVGRCRCASYSCLPKVPPLSIEQRQAQLHQCPSETAQLSVHAASPLTSSVSSTLSAPSGLSTSTKARLTFQDRNQVPVVIEIPPSGGFLGRALECLVKWTIRRCRASGDDCFAGRSLVLRGSWQFESVVHQRSAAVSARHQRAAPPRHPAQSLDDAGVYSRRNAGTEYAACGRTDEAVGESAAAAQLWAYFLTVNDDGETRLIAIPEAGALLGRSRGCLLHTEDPTISRQHARIIVRGDTLQIEDLSKDQGTWIAGVRLVGEQRPLHSGDLVAAGQLRARFLGKNAQFADLDERFRPFRVRCPIGKIGPLLFRDTGGSSAPSATVILRVLPRNAPQYDRWLALLHAESRLLRSHPYSNPTGGTLLRELPGGDRLLSAPLGCGLLLSEFLATYGAPPLMVLGAARTAVQRFDQRAQRDPTRREGQLLVREVWIYADPLAPAVDGDTPAAGVGGRWPASVADSAVSRDRHGGQPPHPQQPRCTCTDSCSMRCCRSRPMACRVPSWPPKCSSKLPAVVTDLLHELLLDSAARRPDPYHAQRWLADLRSLLVTHS